MEKEIWKDIFGGKYQISSLGNIRSLNYHREKRIKELSKLKMPNGYTTVKLCVDGEVKRYSIHRLVANTFIPNPKNKPQVNHIDGNKQNNNVDNLEWCTKSENQIHAVRNGLQKTIPILQYDLQGNFIKEWESSSEAGRHIKISPTNITACCNNRMKTARGFIWKYKDAN